MRMLLRERVQQIDLRVRNLLEQIYKLNPHFITNFISKYYKLGFVVIEKLSVWKKAEKVVAIHRLLKCYYLLLKIYIKFFHIKKTFIFNINLDGRRSYKWTEASSIKLLLDSKRAKESNFIEILRKFSYVQN